MLEAVSLFIVCLVTHILDCYVFSKLVNETFKFNIKNILIIVMFSIIDYFVSVNDITVLKLVVSNIITFLVLKLVYNNSTTKTLIATIFTYIGYVLSEIVFVLIFISLFKINSDFFISGFGLILSNIFIFIIYILLFHIKKFRKLINMIMQWYDKNKIFSLIIKLFIILLFCYSIIYLFSFEKIIFYKNEIILLVLSMIIMFVFGYFNEKSNNNKLTIEYGQLLEYVKDYEKEVVEKGKKQHEYKNQLIVINDMIPKTNKKLKKYVEAKLEVEEKMNDNIWLEKLTNLPSGGIKGLIYFKLKKMIENNIDVYIDVDIDLSDEKEWFNVDKYLEDYTRILGVYLDNAIEASIESKDKQIIIEFIDNNDNIEFRLSNTYNGIINYQNIDKEKYSTKGKGRGYGLPLVKDIIEKNKLLNQKRELNGKFYVQKLIIKK